MRGVIAICGLFGFVLIGVNTSHGQCQPVPNYSAYVTFAYDGTNLSAQVTVSGETIGNWSQCMGSGTHTPEITGTVNSGSQTTWSGNGLCPGCYLTYTNGPTVPAQAGQMFTFQLQGSVHCTVVGLFWTTFWSPFQIQVTAQIPKSLQVISATSVPLTNFKNCVLADYGIALAIDYQVLDQNGSKILSSAMEPIEKILNVVFNGLPIGDTEPNWVDIGPSGYPGTSKFTNTSGQFTDAPWGACSNGAFTETLTQPIGILLNEVVYTVRTANWTTTGTGAGHGSATNGTDISVSH
jgi:hypothetical protein